MLFVVVNIDLNQDTFNKIYGDHVILDHGPQGGYLHKLSFETIGAKVHEIDIIRDRQCVNLQSALIF